MVMNYSRALSLITGGCRLAAERMPCKRRYSSTYLVYVINDCFFVRLLFCWCYRLLFHGYCVLLIIHEPWFFLGSKKKYLKTHPSSATLVVK